MSSFFVRVQATLPRTITIRFLSYPYDVPGVLQNKAKVFTFLVGLTNLWTHNVSVKAKYELHVHMIEVKMKSNTLQLISVT